MTRRLLWTALLAAAPAAAASEFLANVNKATNRVEPQERVEYYSRAIKAWLPADSKTLLAQCHFGRGEARLDSYAFEQARGDLSRALELDPRNARAYLLRARANARLGRLQDAAQDLIEYVGRMPSDLEGLLLLSAVELEAGRGDAALRAAALAKQNENADERAWLAEARVYMARKDWPRAERALDAANDKAGRGSADILAERAVCRVALGRLDDGRADYSEALAIHARALEDLGRGRRHPAEIAEQQDKAARAYFGRGRVNEFLALHAEALTDYAEACRLGHREACARREAAAPRAERRPRPREAAPPAPKPKKAPTTAPAPRPSRPDNDPGERIYGG